ncbi:MAG: GGDEF domain-containing protein [Bryobacteraceae bacterium]
MISLKDYLQYDPNREAVLRRAVGLLLQGMGLHAVEGRPTEYTRFCDSLNALAAHFDEEMPAADVIGLAGAALKMLDDYNQRTVEYLQMPGAEFRAMARMLMSAISTLAAAGKENASHLREIEENLVSASVLEDVRQVRQRLSECLGAIRTETERQRAQTEKAVESLSRQLDRAQGESQANRNDPVTGLAPRKTAEEAIERACQSPADHFVAMFCVDRVQTISLRFGYEVGDDVLRHYADFLRQRLPEADPLFRWTGPTLAAVLERRGRVEIVRGEIARLVDEPLEHTVSSAKRAILLPIAARWSIFQCLPDPQLLIASIGDFTQTQTAGNGGKRIPA